MKTSKTKPTRAQLEQQGSAPETFRCTCGHVAFSKYALKSHKQECWQ